MKYKLFECNQILNACKEILHSNTLTTKGICATLLEKLYKYKLSYSVIYTLMDDAAKYCDGISPPGILSDERVMFLLLIVDNTPRELQQLLEYGE